MGRFALHFDQQYDTIKIELDRGEEFFMTVKEAEDKGYRRAWRWRGNKAGDGKILKNFTPLRLSGNKPRKVSLKF